MRPQVSPSMLNRANTPAPPSFPPKTLEVAESFPSHENYQMLSAWIKEYESLLNDIRTTTSSLDRLDPRNADFIAGHFRLHELYGAFVQKAADIRSLARI